MAAQMVTLTPTQGKWGANPEDQGTLAQGFKIRVAARFRPARCKGGDWGQGWDRSKGSSRVVKGVGSGSREGSGD